MALPDGARLAVRRGRDRAAGRHFRLVAESGRVIEGDLPGYTMPAVKNAAGFFAEDEMDLVDLFVGSEGVLGGFSEMELRLAP